jgi:FKBP-type peptidyl-prolyl isomerase-like protein
MGGPPATLGGNVTTVNFSRTWSPVGLAVCAASAVTALAACSSDKPASSPSTSTHPTAPAMTAAQSPPPTAASGCPTQAPGNGGTPEWTLSGATGSVSVTGSTDTAAPLITVTQPFSVTETEVHTLRAGDGPVVAPTATVSVCYMGVDGRDGKVFDSSYERGTPAQFPLDGVVPGFQKAIAGQKVGSTVGVAMNSADGYPEGQPQAGIQKGDSLIFAIKILSAGS